MDEKEAPALNPVWKRHLDGIADEIVRLTAVCDVDLRAPGVIDRVLKDDATVCGSRNPVAFEKLRKLLVATYASLEKAVAHIGKDQTRAITDAIIERVDARRALGGRPKGASDSPLGKE